MAHADEYVSVRNWPTEGGALTAEQAKAALDRVDDELAGRKTTPTATDWNRYLFAPTIVTRMYNHYDRVSGIREVYIQETLEWR
jgi:hypothetical protein